MVDFLRKNVIIIIFGLILIFFFKTCGDSREISKLKQHVFENGEKSYTKTDFEQRLIILGIQIELEGLKNEKRMIQSTDRKILDVNRQTQIDIEVIKLEEKLEELNETLDKPKL